MCSQTLCVASRRTAHPRSLTEQAGKRQYVLRKKPHGRVLASAHAVDREFRITSALSRSQVSIPRFSSHH